MTGDLVQPNQNYWEKWSETRTFGQTKTPVTDLDLYMHTTHTVMYTIYIHTYFVHTCIKVDCLIKDNIYIHENKDDCKNSNSIEL